MEDVTKLHLKFPLSFLEVVQNIPTEGNYQCNLEAQFLECSGTVCVKKDQSAIELTIGASSSSLLHTVENGWSCQISSISTDTTEAQAKQTTESFCQEMIHEILDNCFSEVAEEKDQNHGEYHSDTDVDENLCIAKEGMKKPKKRKAKYSIRQRRKRIKVNASNKRSSKSRHDREENLKDSQLLSIESEIQLNILKEESSQAVCELCSKTYVKKSSLKRHVEMNHGVEWEVYQLNKGKDFGDINCDNVKEEMLTGRDSNKGRHKNEPCKICNLNFGTMRRSKVTHCRKIHGITLKEYEDLDSYVNQEEKDSFLKEKLKKLELKQSRTECCKVCNRQLANLTALKLHIQNFHASSEDLLLEAEKKHSASNTSALVINCPLCPEARNGKSIFRHFRDIHSKDKNFSKLYDDLQRNFKQYRLKHEREKYQEILKKRTARCKFCDAELEHRWARNRHQRKCPKNPHPTKYLHCTVCNQSFSSQAQLEEHKKKHPEGQHFICELCGSSYRNRSGLYVHLRKIHDVTMKAANNKYNCPVCNKHFFDKNRCEEHCKRHSDVRDKICDHCGKSFKTDTDVQRHIRTVHENHYPYHCEMCGHGLSKLSYLKNHKCGRVRRVQSENEKGILQQPKEAQRVEGTNNESQYNISSRIGDHNYENVHVMQTAAQNISSIDFSGHSLMHPQHMQPAPMNASHMLMLGSSLPQSGASHPMTTTDTEYLYITPQTMSSGFSN